MKFTREFFEDRVLIIRNREQLDRVLGDLEVSGKLEHSKIGEITVKTFPMLVYKGRFESIDIAEIEEDAVLQLKYDPDFSKRVVEFN